VKLYDELADWWPLMSPPEDYAEEALRIAALLAPERRETPPRLLELGSGGGHLAFHLKARFVPTLVDRAPRMLELSRRLNPECRHLEGDMRTLRLGETFDVVLIFDAVSHLADAAELDAALAAARTHLAPGGRALFCPDWTVETFRPGVSTGGVDGADRGLRYVEWIHPEIDGTSYRTEIAYLLRQPDGSVACAHDAVRLGVFSRAHWRCACRRAGFATAEVLQIADRDVISARAG
jgi:SAM-dependent methyltransferase